MKDMKKETMMNSRAWEVKQLGEVCDFQGGSQPPKSNFIFEPRKGYVRFLQIRDFGSDKNITYIPEAKKNRHCNKDDILLGRYGASVGKVLVNKAGAYNVAVMKTIPNETVLYKRYLFFYLNTDDFQSRLLKTASRSAQDGFSKNDIFDFPILLPPLPVQQRIVAILDEAFAAITKAKANAEQNLLNAKELFESYLQGVFENKGEGWEEKTLKEISLEFARGKSKHRPRGDASLLNGEYPLIQTGDISNANHWINEYSQTYNEKGLAQSKLWKKGTICIAIVGANVAETAILNFDACFPDSVIGIVVNPARANNEYVDYLLQTFKTYLKEKGKGTARDNINLGTFESQRFPFPSVKKQVEIVQKLDVLSIETKKLETIYQQKINDLEELKKSVLQKAFSGELKTEKAIAV